PTQPNAVVEVEVDIAFEHGRWRHPVRFVRYRPDLSSQDVPVHTATWP
ncbi:MAG: ATP-dependent DNA ligase, partial [Dactylosporangium sp.]|nr:ATP-dependent DNA ligase [Dactylosporangium sp.]